MSQQDNYENLISDDLFYQLGLKINWKGEFYGKAQATNSTKEILGKEEEGEKA